MFDFLERRLEEIIAGVCVVIMCGMVFLHVVMRYFFNEPISWSDEIAQYMMLWSVYMSISWATRERAHIRVLNFVNMFPREISTIMVVISDLIWLTFSILLTWQSVLLEISFWENTYESPALGIDQKWPYLCLVFGFGLMTIRLIQVYYRWIKYRDPLFEPPEDEDMTHV